MLRRSRIETSARDSGYTLSELLVAMALTTIIGAAGLAFFVVSNSANRVTYERVNNTAQARVTLDSWTALLRVADAPVPGSNAGRIVELTPNQIVFYANLDNRNASGPATAPTKIRLALDSDQLTETRYDAAGSVVVKRSLATGSSASDPSGWVFTASAGGSTIPSASLCTSAGAPVTGYCDTGAVDFGPTAGGGAMLSTIDRIVIGVKVTDTQNRAPNVVSSSVTFTG